MDWTRGATIGRGGSSATVSVATACQSTATLAVKSTELSCSETLQREQRILSSLTSPHIVTYKGCDITNENNNLFYNLFMEYLPGGTITDAIRQRGGNTGLEESTIGLYTRQIVQGLEYLHSSGIIHCDIKCSNILLGDNGPKIADFGCAKKIDEAEAGSIGGTPLFMSPEVARGDEQNSPADIWALGCSVIEMATGGSPWPNSKDPISALYRIAFSGEIPEIPDFLSIQGKDFLRKCLRREPEERWTAKQLLNHPFIGELDNCNCNCSPTSILDQGFWSEMEESETSDDHHHQKFLNKNCWDPPIQRIRRLSLMSDVKPNWRSWDDEDSWIGIRCSKSDGCDEFWK